MPDLAPKTQSSIETRLHASRSAPYSRCVLYQGHTGVYDGNRTRDIGISNPTLYN